METRRVVVLTEHGQVLPMNVKWVKKFSTGVNVSRYVKPLIGADCVVAICRGDVSVGPNTWHYKYSQLPLWEDATSMLKNNNMLWEA